MKKIIALILMGVTLSGCSLLRTHKLDVEQGNIITQDDAIRLHRGMSEAEVRDIMGNPVLQNIFSANRLIYVYTFKPGYGQMKEKRIICTFQNGRLVDIQRG